MSGAGWPRARNLLAVRLDTIGDVLMTTPALRALRESAPERRLTLLTSRSGAAVARLVPEVDDVMVYEAPWMKASGEPGDPAADLEVVRRLEARGFDAAVIFTVYSQSSLPAALLCRLARIPLRLAHSRDKPYALLTDWVRESEPQLGVRHEVRRQLDLVAHAAASTGDERLSLRVPPEASAAMRARLGEAGIAPEGPWAVMHPGASAESRRWPAEAFAEAARVLWDEDGVRVVITGDDSERGLASRIAGMNPGTVTLAGELSIPELAALIELSPLLVAGNTGPVHLAAAVGTPVVDVYALTNPQHQPWLVPSRVLSHDVPCRWCHSSVCLTGHHDCIEKVSPADVVRAARALTAGRLTPAPAG
jgi:lipopolysaccharide heptosyltransferase II